MSATEPRGRPRSFDRDVALERAMWQFWEHGYDGASISDLTTAMGIGAPSLYAAFGSKDELFRAAVRRYGEREGAVTERALRDPATARAAVEAMLRGNADAYADPATPAGCLIVLGATTPTPRNAAARTLLAAKRRETTAKIAARIRRGIADGDVPPGTDVDTLAAYCNTVLEGLSIQARDGTGREALQAIVACALGGWDAATR